jgi:glycosyltransferase involved in cell wall biosynthesis
MSTSIPLISVIIPTFNRAHLIVETIDSIINQSFQDWECIVVDDGSTDETEFIVGELIALDSRLSFYKKPKHLPKGPSAARNYGFTKSKGTYINWFDSDDIMDPQKMQIDLNHITLDCFDFTISQSVFFRKVGEPKKNVWNKTIWSNDPINDFITKALGWGINSPLWLKSSLVANNLEFDEKLMTADDFKYHLQALQFNLRPVIIEQNLVNLREHDNRLNDYSDKASNKLRTYLYLIENSNTLDLNTNTKSYLNWHFVKFFAWLMKRKKVVLGGLIFLKCLSLNFTIQTKFKVFRLLTIGFFYLTFRKGYKLLKH